MVILFIFALAFQFLGVFLAGWIYGFSFSEMISLGAYDDPRYVAATKFIQIIGSVGTFIIPAFIFSFLFEGDFCSYFRFRSPTSSMALLLTVMMMIVIIPFINYLAELNMRIEFPVKALDQFLRTLENEAEKMMRAFTSTGTFQGLLVNLLMIGIIAAVGEELIFRGLLQRLLTGMVKNRHVGIVLTAALFSAFHFQFFSFLPRFVLGLILGYLMLYGRSIWYPILAHFVNNTMSVIYYYFNSRGNSDDMLEEIGTSNMIPVAALISLMVFLFLSVLWYYRISGITTRSPLPGGTEKD